MLASQFINAKLLLCLLSTLMFFNLASLGEKPGEMAKAYADISWSSLLKRSGH